MLQILIVFHTKIQRFHHTKILFTVKSDYINCYNFLGLTKNNNTAPYLGKIFQGGADSSPTSFATRFWDYTGLSKKMDGIWNRYNLKSTGRIYTFGVLKYSEKFKVLDLLFQSHPLLSTCTWLTTGVNIAPASQGHPLSVPVSTTSASAV